MNEPFKLWLDVPGFILRIEALLVAVALFKLCDSMIPPHMPTQCKEVKIPTMNKTAYEALFNRESMSKPLVFIPSSTIAATIIRIPINL